MRRTHNALRDYALQHGFVPVEYTNQFTVMEHHKTGAQISIPVTNTVTTQMHQAQWVRIRKEIQDGSGLRGTA